MGTFADEQMLGYSPRLKERFLSGRQRRIWLEAYGNTLFDEEDQRIAESQSSAHFYEWFGAVVMHHATGYHCLLQKYQFKPHPRKRKVLRRIAPPALLDLFDTQAQRGFSTMQGPDLLMYAPDESDFFFCEVKGPNDRLRAKQKRYFAAISEAADQQIELLCFRRLKNGGSSPNECS